LQEKTLEAENLQNICSAIKFDFRLKLNFWLNFLQCAFALECIVFKGVDSDFKHSVWTAGEQGKQKQPQRFFGQSSDKNKRDFTDGDTYQYHGSSPHFAAFVLG
jgi:hypothetical protein